MLVRAGPFDGQVAGVVWASLLSSPSATNSRLGCAATSTQLRDVGRLHPHVDATDTADPTPFRRFSSAKSTSRCINVSKRHTCRQNLPNRPQTPRSTMAPISRGHRKQTVDARRRPEEDRYLSYGISIIWSCRDRVLPIANATNGRRRRPPNFGRSSAVVARA